ncbi:ComEA family DNA-binding protein [Bordetella bronchiseptica]
MRAPSAAANAGAGKMAAGRIDRFVRHASKEHSMNPFLHDPVARCASAPAWPLVGRGRLWRPRPPGAAARAPAGKAPAGRKPASEPLARWLVMAGCALAAAPAHALDVNTATVEQLETVRGVGPRTARVIIEERQRGGRFLSLEDLSERVSGIGLKKMQSLQAAGLTAGPAAPAAGARPEARPAGGPRAKAAAGR